jgi:hypothetical protein
MKPAWFGACELSGEAQFSKQVIRQREFKNEKAPLNCERGFILK